jgi:nucleoid-associated protein YgaU
MAAISIPSAAAVKTIVVQGGNLFQIAAVELGDATQWNRIAALNGLNDFLLPAGTLITLSLPPVNPSGGNGGILGA